MSNALISNLGIHILYKWLYFFYYNKIKINIDYEFVVNIILNKI